MLSHVYLVRGIEKRRAKIVSGIWDGKKKEKRGGVANRNSFHYLRKYNDRLDSILKRVVRVVATNTHAHTKSSQQKKATERNLSLIHI